MSLTAVHFYYRGQTVQWTDGHLAGALKSLLVKFDNLWHRPFPYVMTLHQSPTDDGSHRSFHFHIEIHPPLRRPSLLKVSNAVAS